MTEHSDIQINLDQMIRYAISRPSYKDAKPIEDYLNWQFRDCGTPEIFAKIDNIARHFKEHSEESMVARITRQLEARFKRELGLPEIQLTDGQVAECIVELMPSLGFDNQWLAIYRILVDFCNFPKEIQAFCDKIDECLAGQCISRPCRYQNIQKYLDGIFKEHYRKWHNYPHQEETAFVRQKQTAGKLLEIIRIKAETI